jgi:predicted transcriptional regulator of viral defense system
MNFLVFRKNFFDLACFTPGQVYAWMPEFDRNNLVRWGRQGWLVKLRNGFYSFPEYLDVPGFNYYVANRIYRPSYISLHAALAFHGMIPEAVLQITSVTSLKTMEFSNRFGKYSYKTVRPELIFGYEQKPFLNDRVLLLAQPEKAITDLLYLYPFYNSEKEIEALRLDEDFMTDHFDYARMQDYVSRFNQKQLEKRMNLLIKIYRT